jgi:opacity protein-like surface antigen
MHRVLSYAAPIVLLGISFALGQVKSELSPALSFYSETKALVIQDQSQNEQSENSKSSLYIQFNTSGLYSSLTDWKNQLHLSDGTHPSGINITFGTEAGWIINKYIQVGIGYEFFFTTKISAIEADGDQINSTYLYGSFRGSIPLESVRNLSLFGNIDIGSLSATEVLENYHGFNFDKIGSATAYRFMVGAQYYLIDNWSIMAGTGYFFGKVNNVTANGQTWPNFSLDLSGFTLRFAVNYHFQL